MQTQKQPYLEVHVFGGWSEGEGIVIRLPDGSYGVVDSCVDLDKDGQERSPIVCFLKSRNVSELRFLCLTHPHKDHFRGMLTLFETFRPREFWHPGALSGAALKQMIQRGKTPALEVNAHALRDAFDELEQLYLAIAKRVRTRNSSARFSIQEGSMNQTLFENITKGSSTGFSIKSLAPHGNDSFRFRERLAKAFDGSGYLKADLPEEKFNLISMALLIICPAFRILLGGDVENASWGLINQDATEKDWRSRLFKISHHGSKGAFCATLKAAVFSEGCGTNAVVTGFKKCNLPDSEVLAEVKSLSERVGVTHHRHIKKSAIVALDESRAAIAKQFNIELEQLDSSRAALGAFLGVNPRLENKTAGLCSFYFDKKGRLLNSEARHPATWL